MGPRRTSGTGAMGAEVVEQPERRSRHGRALAQRKILRLNRPKGAVWCARTVASVSQWMATMGSVSGHDSVRPPASDVKLTYDDFVQFPDDGKRHELIDGEHVVTPSPNTKHQTIVLNLGSALRAHARTHDLGRVFVAPFDVVFSDVDVVEPDLLFVAKARQADVLTATHVRGTPDLVVEVGSPSTRRRDETIKRRLYERFGVEEYWVVDPELDELRVYRHVEGRFDRVALLAREQADVLTSPLFPGLALPLVDVFDDA